MDKQKTSKHLNKVMVLWGGSTLILPMNHPELYEPLYLAWTRKNFEHKKFRVIGSLN